MQWRMLGRRGGQASWTIVGDARAERLARPGRGAPGPRRGAARQAGAPVPPEHQLPQLGRDLRVRRAGGDAGRCPTPTCRSRCAARAWRPSIGWSPSRPRSRPSWPRPWPNCSASVDGHGRVIIVRPTGGAAARSWLGDPVDAPAAGRGRHAGQGHGVRRRARAWRPEEIAAESPAGVRVLYVALTRATHRLITMSATSAWRPHRLADLPGRGEPVARRSEREPDRAGHAGHLGAVVLVQPDHRRQPERLGQGERLVDGVDRPARHTGRAEALHPVRRGSGRQGAAAARR